MAALLVFIASVAATSGTSVGPASGAPSGPGRGPIGAAEGTAPYRNVVLILVDDMSTLLFDEVDRLRSLADEGVRFTDYLVADSLCCTSRTSMLTGQYVHNHGVLSNRGRRGGFAAFQGNGHDRDNLGIWLQRSGIQTAYVGKYLNGYPGAPGQPDTVPAWAPGGWDRFLLPDAGAYNQYGYRANVDGVWTTFGWSAADYNTDVLADEAQRVIAEATGPFFLTVAPFGPHVPATPPSRYADDFADRTYPARDSHNVQNPDEPRWLQDYGPRPASEAAAFDATWRDMLRSSEAIADLVDDVRAALVAAGQADRTLLAFASDNGYHFGEHRLPQGKRTPYDEDLVVPLVLVAPDLVPRTVTGLASGVDLAPTILAALGAPTPPSVDGRSLLDLAAGGIWPRNSSYSEHLTRKVERGDPDYDSRSAPSVAFRVVRTRDWVYVRYPGDRPQLFAAQDEAQLFNLAPYAPRSLMRGLDDLLDRHAGCAAAQCRWADRFDVPGDLTGPLLLRARIAATYR